MALKATLRRAVRQAFEALDDVPRTATYHSVSGAPVRDLDAGTFTRATTDIVLPMCAFVRFSSKDLERDSLIEVNDVKVLFPAEDLKAVRPKASDRLTDDEGVLWEVKRQLNDPASVVVILQCKAV